MDKNKIKSEIEFPYRRAMHYATQKESNQDYQICNLDYPNALGVDVSIVL